MQSLASQNTLPDTVSQSDIERLLAEAGAGDLGGEDVLAGGTPSLQRNDFLQRHDFPHLSLFSPTELRKLRMRHEEFINSLAARLSIRFGMEITMQMSKFETITFGTFVDNLANPTHLTILNLEPLHGPCLLNIPLKLALCHVDRELGGTGLWQDEPRELTRMEVTLMGRVVENILSEWCGIWKDLADLRPTITGCENNGRFVQTCPPNTMMMVLGMEMQMGAVVEEMQLALACPMLEPLMTKLGAAVAAGQKPSTPRATSTVKWNPLLDDMELRVSAEMPEVLITAEQLVNLKAGDVIPIQADRLCHVQVCLEGSPKFEAMLGLDKQRWAVKLTETLKS